MHPGGAKAKVFSRHADLFLCEQFPRHMAIGVTFFKESLKHARLFRKA